ncbi:MAG TPA: hypothetical protein DCM32_08100 [Xanthomonadaceae bacterium]|nr:hypothetical protein [Xanthomonadaceae bacterium]
MARTVTRDAINRAAGGLGFVNNHKRHRMRLLLAFSDPRRAAALDAALHTFGIEWRVELVDRDSDAVPNADTAALLVDPALPGAATLLRRWLYAAPEVARLLLRPPANEALPAALLALAHGVLDDQGPIEALTEALLGYAALAAALDRPALRAQVGALTRLPGAPRLYLSISRALDDPTLDVGRIAEQVMADPVLAARVLQIANSALYGAGRRIDSIPVALGRLGLKTTRQLVLAAELYAFDGADAGRAARARQQSLVAAWLAPRLLAPGIDPDVAATAAVLAGLGGMLPELDDDGVPTLAGAPALADEAAAYLLGLWQLPSNLQQAVAWQRCPRLSGGGFGLVGAVHVATALAFERSVDESWLQRAGMAAHLPAWRDLLARIDRSVA